MQIFDLDDERTAATALQAPLHQHCQRTGLIFLGTESGQVLRLAGTSQQVQEIGCSYGRIDADRLETAAHLRRHDSRDDRQR